MLLRSSPHLTALLTALTLGVAAALSACADGSSAPDVKLGNSAGPVELSRVYRLGIGDKIKLTVFGEAEMSGIYDVNGSYLNYTDKMLPVWYPDSDGVLIPFELAWLPRFDGGRLPGSSRRCPT